MANGTNEVVVNASADLTVVTDQGMRIWYAVKNAKDEEQRDLSYDFLKLPHKKHYPDYYAIIKSPICLEDIKKRLERREFGTLEAVKAEFDQCFRNAKKYNMKDSQIWLDAKALQKIVNTEYRAIVGLNDEVTSASSDDESEEEDEEWEAGKPNGKARAAGRSPNMYRFMKARMDKLVAKTDNTGRALSEVFMEFPSKKLYPIYYKTIKKPMCFNAINRRIQRKEYSSMAEFAAEVELVFQNAVTFNEEHSIIWEDATVLKAYFKQLMSDLPPPYTLSEYSQNGKLKLRLPAQAHLNGFNMNMTGTGLKVKLPPLAAATATTAVPVQPSPKPAHVPIKQASHSPNIAAKLTPQAQPQVQYQQPQLQPQVAQQPNPTYLRPANFAQLNPIQPQPQYQYHPQPISQPQSSAQSISPSPLPATPVSTNVTFDHPLRSVTLKTMPLGRTLRLDSSEGVRTWVLRLSRAETKVDILDVSFEEFESDDEDEEEPEEEVIVKANGTQINASVPPVKEGEDGGENGVNIHRAGPVWEVSDLRAGTNILEVGEKAGEIWKIVLQRIAVV
ncbi:hypothetical protein M422DRAFT_58438 [Sphaerobolus stellatus SS14]|nr:hypothetical protein M422DRAFT_58438 [Sphaerobolus stellatus SS14]